MAAPGAAVALLLLLGTLVPPPAGGPGRAVGDHVWQRPTEQSADDAFEVPVEQQHAVDTEHFRVHWTDQGVDAATPAFVKDVLVVLEEVWDAEIERLGWPPPRSDGDRGGDARIDVYLLDLDDGPFGYAAADDVACGRCTSVPGFLVMENDFVGYAPGPAVSLRSTAAHEFAHLVQMGLAWDVEPWAYEATAVWLEQLVYPEADARTPYLVDFADHPGLPLTDFGEGSGGFDRSYGAYVWNLFLADVHGPELVRRAWELAADDDGHILGGYAGALAEVGSSLDRAFTAFTAATTTWEVGGFPGEPATYPMVQRAGSLARGETMRISVDHTAAHIVELDVGDATTVTVRGPRLVAGGVAVTATGGGRVVQAIDPTLFDGQAQVTLDGIGGAGRVTLVIVNADAALARPKPRGTDRADYLNDDVEFVVGVDIDPGPPQKPR